MTGKVLTLRRPDTCVGCGAGLDAGSRAGWDASSRTVSCLVCISSESVDPIASSAEPPSDAAQVDRGVGGGSAQLEFDRRHAARRDRVLSNHPRIGPVLLALFDDASSTKAWAQGAAGERAVAARLDAIEGALVLHDRRLRRPDGRLSRGNIDHLAIVPTGVWVIDAETHRGRLEVLRMGGLRSPRVERLRINGRDQTALVDGVHRQPRPSSNAGAAPREHLRQAEPVRSPSADPAGFLLVHFVEDREGHGERVFFSLSDGDDPTGWSRANGGDPVLESRIGTTGVRDPHLVRGDDGFVLIATDLRVWGHGEPQWDELARSGSRSILVWRSPDLVAWTGPELVEVAPPTAGMAWAPESRWDPAAGEYRVSWSSALYAEDDPDHRGAGYSRILEARTRDFRTFTTPEVVLDTGRSVIDARVAEVGGRVVRFAKEEPGPGSRGVFQEVDDGRDGFTVVASGIGTDRYALVEGPMLVEDPRRDRWLLWLDQYDRLPQGFVAYASDDPLSGRWEPLTGDAFRIPPSTKHGSVLALTAEEDARLRSAFG